MSDKVVDIAIVGAGPVGLMCAYLGSLCGLNVIAIDKSSGPLEVGRADALNARTLQLLEIVGLFNKLYPLGKPCNTSAVFENGKFISRQSQWWDSLKGCFHKHFLMLGQSYLEKLLDKKLKERQVTVLRDSTVIDLAVDNENCFTTLSNGEKIQSTYVIGADGAQSFVRNHFNISFEITRPQIIWAVIDGFTNTNFPKNDEIIVFQSNSSDVAYIPRENNLDRFYIRMDKVSFSQSEILKKINHAVSPYTLSFKKVVWSSKFSVKESVAESFSYKNRVFLAGDACHIHSVNGGQGLNTGLSDAFNLIWKLNSVIKNNSSPYLLNSYETERKPVAKSVIKTSGDLVRATKNSQANTHAKDYVKLIETYAGNITGMGISYSDDKIIGNRLYDFECIRTGIKQRIYSQLSYRRHSLLIFSDKKITIKAPLFIQVINILQLPNDNEFYAPGPPFLNQAILVRPDGYIQNISSLSNIDSLYPSYLEMLSFELIQTASI